MVWTYFKTGWWWWFSEPDSGTPRKTWKDVVDKDVNDLHLKWSDAMDCCKWRDMSRGNLSNIATAIATVMSYISRVLTLLKAAVKLV